MTSSESCGRSGGPLQLSKVCWKPPNEGAQLTFVHLNVEPANIKGHWQAGHTPDDYDTDMPPPPDLSLVNPVVLLLMITLVLSKCNRWQKRNRMEHRIYMA